MSYLHERAVRRRRQQLEGLSLPGNEHYAAATSIWAKPLGPLPHAVAHCRALADVQSAVRTARARALPLSVRGGGHAWAGRALCGGIVLDLRGRTGVALGDDHRCARIAGGA